MNNYTQPLIDAGMKPVDAFQLVAQVKQFMQQDREDVIEKIIQGAMKRFGQNPEIYAALVDLRYDSQADRRADLMKNLIDGIQAADVKRVKEAIQAGDHAFEKEKAALLRKKDGTGVYPTHLVNAELPGSMGFTPLHVACGNYKMRPNQRILLNEIIDALLKTGACPWTSMGERYEYRMVNGFKQRVLVDPGKTIAQVCGKDLAPSYQAKVAEWSEGDGRALAYEKKADGQKKSGSIQKTEAEQVAA